MPNPWYILPHLYIIIVNVTAIVDHDGLTISRWAVQGMYVFVLHIHQDNFWEDASRPLGEGFDILVDRLYQGMMSSSITVMSSYVVIYRQRVMEGNISIYGEESAR